MGLIFYALIEQHLRVYISKFQIRGKVIPANKGLQAQLQTLYFLGSVSQLYKLRDNWTNVP